MPYKDKYQGDYKKAEYRQEKKKKTGAKLTNYTNSDGEAKTMASGWNTSKAGFLTFKAYPMTKEGAKALAKSREYSSDYSNITSKGNERWFYEAEFMAKGEVSKKFYSGIAIYKKSSRKLYFSRFNKVASFNKNYFGKI